MSTRATFKFVSERRGAGSHTAYIHHDGYPIGAAGYLSNDAVNTDAMANPIVVPIPNINTFIRANKKAEMTQDHDSHADTDYRYTIKGSYIIAEERVKEDALVDLADVDFSDYGRETFKTFWEGDIVDFLIIFCPHADDLKFINKGNN